MEQNILAYSSIFFLFGLAFFLNLFGKQKWAIYVLIFNCCFAVIGMAYHVRSFNKTANEMDLRCQLITQKKQQKY